MKAKASFSLEWLKNKKDVKVKCGIKRKFLALNKAGGTVIYTMKAYFAHSTSDSFFAISS